MGKGIKKDNQTLKIILVLIAFIVIFCIFIFLLVGNIHFYDTTNRDIDNILQEQEVQKHIG